MQKNNILCQNMLEFSTVRRTIPARAQKAAPAMSCFQKKSPKKSILISVQSNKQIKTGLWLLFSIPLLMHQGFAAASENAAASEQSGYGAELPASAQVLTDPCASWPEEQQPLCREAAVTPFLKTQCGAFAWIERRFCLQEMEALEALILKSSDPPLLDASYLLVELLEICADFSSSNWDSGMRLQHECLQSGIKMLQKFIFPDSHHQRSFISFCKDQAGCEAADIIEFQRDRGENPWTEILLVCSGFKDAEPCISRLEKGADIVKTAACGSLRALDFEEGEESKAGASFLTYLSSLDFAPLDPDDQAVCLQNQESLSIEKIKACREQGKDASIPPDGAHFCLESPDTLTVEEIRSCFSWGRGFSWGGPAKGHETPRQDSLFCMRQAAALPLQPEKISACRDYGSYSLYFSLGRPDRIYNRIYNRVYMDRNNCLEISHNENIPPYLISFCSKFQSLQHNYQISCLERAVKILQEDAENRITYGGAVQKSNILSEVCAFYSDPKSCVQKAMLEHIHFSVVSACSQVDEKLQLSCMETVQKKRNEKYRLDSDILSEVCAFYSNPKSCVQKAMLEHIYFPVVSACSQVDEELQLFCMETAKHINPYSEAHQLYVKRCGEGASAFSKNKELFSSCLEKSIELDLSSAHVYHCGRASASLLSRFWSGGYNAHYEKCLYDKD